MKLSDLAWVDDTGYHYADFPSFLEFKKQQYREIYGEDVYIEPDSQDGQLIAAEAQAMYDTAVNQANTLNQFSPSTAQGVNLANVVKINGIKKRKATNSTAEVLIEGTIGTTILNGIVQDANGVKWNLPESVTIPSEGEITVTATAQEKGALRAQANTITKIFTPTNGWQTVTNPTEATAGEPIETDAQLRVRQTISTAIPAKSVFESTKAAVANVSGVVRSEGFENDTGSIDANALPPHSIAMVVEGGDDTEIAEAIAVKKTPGTTTYGSTSVIVFDDKGMPNTINFYRPTIIDILVEIEITALTGYSSQYAPLIKQAIADAINALKIGEDVLRTKLFVPANLPSIPAGSTFDINFIKIAASPGTPAESNVDLLFNEVAASDIADITLTVV